LTIVDLNIIQKNLSEMKVSINHLDLDLKNIKRTSSSTATAAEDKYVEHMDTFLREAQSRYETLECMYNKMNDAYKELVDFYAIDQAKYSLGEFFADLKMFCAQFQQCSDENRKMKETEEKVRRCEEERIQREKEKQAKRTQKERLMQTGTTGGVSSAALGGISNGLGKQRSDMGVMDNLLEALESGKYFEASVSGSSGPGSAGGPRGRRPIARRDHNNLMSTIFRPSFDF
jgi:hypothetical protein